MLKYEYTVAKSKNQRRFRLLFYFCLIRILGVNRYVNADSRKCFSKFTDLRWFLLFEDLYNGEGSLQANKASKNII